MLAKAFRRLRPAAAAMGLDVLPVAVDLENSKAVAVALAVAADFVAVHLGVDL